MTTISEIVSQARRCRRSGDMAATESLARQILQLEPSHAEALHMLTDSLQGSGRLAEAVHSYQQAIQVDERRADLHNDLGIVLAMQGRLEEALICFRRVLELNPDYAEAHNNLGNALRIRGQIGDAIAAFREALRLKPDFADAHHNLGIALLASGSSDQGLASLQQAVRRKPDHADAIASLEQTLERNPNHPEAHNNLGNAFARSGRLEEAIHSYRRAIELKPSFAEAHSNLANVLARQGQLDEAVAAYHEAIRLKPDYADAHINLGSAYKDRADIGQAIACVEQARKLKPQEAVYHSNLLGTLHYHPAYDADAIAAEHRRWEEEHALRFTGTATEFSNDQSIQRRLSIGYVSPDFRDHVVGRNIWPLLRNHDHQSFDITLYANLPFADEMTDRFRKCADHWCSISNLDDEQVAQRIRTDQIDILVDLALHTAGNRLLVFARKPAPVQVTFAGYPGTTGLHTIDYRLTDPHLDPPENDCRYPEASYRLPHTFWCYDPESEERPVAPSPATMNGFITFGCLNNFCKINDDVLRLWAVVLRAVDRSRLLMLAKNGSHRQRTIDFLASDGVVPERVEFLSPGPRPDYLASYDRVDLGLDTFPYNGHTTSLDAFWMGVPVITLVGKTVVGRAGLSQLTNLGLPELVAHTPDEFVRIAVRLARDRAGLSVLRATLRDRMKESPLMDTAGFARAVENAYRSMWRRWSSQTKQ